MFLILSKNNRISYIWQTFCEMSRTFLYKFLHICLLSSRCLKSDILFFWKCLPPFVGAYYGMLRLKCAHTLLAGLMFQCSASLSSVKPAFSRRDLHSSTTARQRRKDKWDIQTLNWHYKSCDLGKKWRCILSKSRSRSINHIWSSICQ